MCLERIPAGEVPAKQREFEAHGWAWVEHKPAQIVLMRKEFDAPVSERAVEEEMRDLMADAYVNLAAPGSPKDLDDRDVGESTVDELERLGQEGGQVSGIVEYTDAEGNTHGSAEVVWRDRER